MPIPFDTPRRCSLCGQIHSRDDINTHGPCVPPVIHPATFNEPILAVIDTYLPKRGHVLDPFVGTGKIYQLERPFRIFTGIEIEPPLAVLDERTVLGSALDIHASDGYYQAIATSPCYGNRMADHHNAKDGSLRRTYTHDMRRWLSDPDYTLDPNNSGTLYWGPKYRNFHRQAWREAIRVLEPGGAFILNVKDFYRTVAGEQERQHITDWHIDTLVELGLTFDTGTLVAVSGMGYGENRGARVQYETVARLVKP